MCGIYCSLSVKSHVELTGRDAEALARRGPDAFGTQRVNASVRGKTWFLTFSSSVLSMRGEQVQLQPVVDERTGSVFCWNGEAWSFDGSNITENDTNFITKRVFDAAANESSTQDAVVEVLRRVAGPYAFVFYDANSLKVYFGRDALGRRSLLVCCNNTNSSELTISSVALSTSTSVSREVEASYIYRVDLNQPQLSVCTVPRGEQLPDINRSRPAIGVLLGKVPPADTIAQLIEQLKKSLLCRVKEVPTYTACGQSEDPSRVAVLFSGGVDCTLLARITHEILPHDQPIDLLNVAFENPRVVSARASEKLKSNLSGNSEMYESCPDRVTGRSSFTELSKVCPQRHWRFVAVNVPYEEFLEHRPTIVHLMHPHNTEMDLSITAALYFAARGQGTMTSSNDASMESRPYKTTARVLLSGLGADELFGGYARHAAAFTRGGYDALNDELELDFTRIGTRNLGRDDRVIAQWGRETRYPFLDEQFVSFALGLPAWEKCGFRYGKIVPKHFETTNVPKSMEHLHPEKILLRCAMWQLNMKGAATEKKRAIQFGARTAKMQNGRSRGTDLVTVTDGSMNGI